MVEARSHRLPAEIQAEIIKGDKRCEAVIYDLSDEGIMLTAFRDGEIDLGKGATFDLQFETPDEDIINLECEVMRSDQKDSDGIEYELGLRISDVSSEYEEFFKSLYIKEMGMF